MQGAQKILQLRCGDQLNGQAASYKILEPMGSGAFGQTYKGEVLETFNASDELTQGQVIVIKMPTLEPERPFAERISRLTEIYKEFLAEYLSLQRLRGMPCVAQVLDYGIYPFDLGRGAIVPVLFIVQQLIEGDQLDQYIKKAYPSKDEASEFRGIPEAADYFVWSRKIANGLLQIHQREVVHGDIWPQNIMVNSKVEPIFIDFGQSLFRDLAFDMVGNEAYTHPYCAPERRTPHRQWYVGADIYSLGGVFFYLATGKNPTQPIEDIDALKNKITATVKRINPGLYHDNSGVVDVIARCLRFSVHGRTPHAEGVLQDLDTFSFFSRKTISVHSLMLSMDLLKICRRWIYSVILCFLAWQGTG